MDDLIKAKPIPWLIEAVSVLIMIVNMILMRGKRGYLSYIHLEEGSAQSTKLVLACICGKRRVVQMEATI